MINNELFQIPLEVQEGSVTVSQLTSVTETIITDVALQVAPNPLNDKAQIEITLAKAGAINFDLYNALGQRVWTQEATMQKGVNQFGFDASELVSGIYFLHATGENISSQVELNIIR